MNRVITSLIAILSIAGVRAQQPAEVPKLVINITVDQLKGDYLQYFAPAFGERGFKRLLNEGLVYHRVQFDFPNLCRSSAIATLFTGSDPCYHGIVTDKKYSFKDKREVSIIHDKAYLGNFTSENFSPLALLSSTIGDELKVASGGRSDIFAIAPDAEEAILSGGRYANAAFWLEDYNGKWATSTYYKNIPWYIDRYNTSEGITNSSDDYTWMPLASTYKAFPYTKSTTPFKYSFPKGDKTRYQKLKTSPFINSEITHLARKFFEYADFGKRGCADMLAITYYAGNYAENAGDDYTMEIQDIYCRLDKEIEALLDLIEKHVGLRQTLIVLTSTGYFESKAFVNGEFPPYGEFFPNRCVSLLNMYLMALYGEGNWVEGYYNRQIFLNRKLIEDKKLDIADLQRKSAEFVAEFSGVQDVTTSGQWLFSNRETGNAAFLRGTHRKTGGDLFLELQPGWKEVNEQQADKSKDLRNNMILTPLIFYGHSITKGEVTRPVKATSIAPTITHVLRIRPPNACSDAPLDEFLRIKN